MLDALMFVFYCESSAVVVTGVGRVGFTFRALPADSTTKRGVRNVRAGRAESSPHESEKSNPTVAFVDREDVQLRCHIRAAPLSITGPE